MTFPGSVQTAIGTPGNMRIGRITGVSPVQVTIESTVLDPNAVGFLGGYIPLLGDVVAVSGQSAQPSSRSASWLVHGRIVGDASARFALAHINVSVTDTTTSAAFVNIVGAGPTVTSWLESRKAERGLCKAATDSASTLAKAASTSSAKVWNTAASMVSPAHGYSMAKTGVKPGILGHLDNVSGAVERNPQER